MGFSPEGFSHGEELPFFFFFFGLAKQLAGHLKFPDQGSNPHPLCPELEPEAAGAQEGLGSPALPLGTQAWARVARAAWGAGPAGRGRGGAARAF